MIFDYSKTTPLYKTLILSCDVENDQKEDVTLSFSLRIPLTDATPRVNEDIDIGSKSGVFVVESVTHVAYQHLTMIRLLPHSLLNMDRQFAEGMENDDTLTNYRKCQQWGRLLNRVYRQLLLEGWKLGAQMSHAFHYAKGCVAANDHARPQKGHKTFILHCKAFDHHKHQYMNAELRMPLYFMPAVGEQLEIHSQSGLFHIEDIRHDYLNKVTHLQVVNLLIHLFDSDYDGNIINLVSEIEKDPLLIEMGLGMRNPSEFIKNYGHLVLDKKTRELINKLSERIEMEVQLYQRLKEEGWGQDE